MTVVLSISVMYLIYFSHYFEVYFLFKGGIRNQQR